MVRAGGSGAGAGKDVGFASVVREIEFSVGLIPSPSNDLRDDGSRKLPGSPVVGILPSVDGLTDGVREMLVGVGRGGCWAGWWGGWLGWVGCTVGGSVGCPPWC